MALETGDDGTGTSESVEGTGNSARLAMLDRINDQNDAARADELMDVLDDGNTEAFVVQQPDGTKTPLTDDAKPDLEAQATIDALAAESGSPETKPQPEMITRKINGRDVTRSLDDWLASAMKVEAADQYLAEAARLRNEQTQRAQASSPVEAPETKAPTVEDDLAIARAIQMGSEEEAVAALRTLRQARPSITTDDVARTIDERLTFNEAISQYRKDYADIVNDPVLNKIALDEDQRLLKLGDRRPYAERYADIGNRVRTWAEGLVKARTPALTPPAADKLARKAAATPVPKAASQKTVSSVEEDPEESTSSIIANIAKSRGGPQWMNGPVTRQ